MTSMQLLMKKKISELESELAIEKAKYMVQEEIEYKLEKELSEKCAEIEDLKKTCCLMQNELDKLQKESKEYVLGMAEIRNLKIELEEQNHRLKTEIADYKKFNDKSSSNRYIRLSAKTFINACSRNTINTKHRENDIDKLVRKLDRLEEVILNNGGRNVYNISIAKADQLVGVPESGSQIIHTNNK